jgi:hypothetical protein
MERYSVVKENNTYNIMEKDNQYIIRSYNSYKKAKHIKNRLNGGGGFNGFTPLFFTENYFQHKYKKDQSKEE